MSKGKCEASVVKVQGNKFSISFHLLPLGAVKWYLEFNGRKLLVPLYGTLHRWLCGLS